MQPHMQFGDSNPLISYIKSRNLGLNSSGLIRVRKPSPPVTCYYELRGGSLNRAVAIETLRVWAIHPAPSPAPLATCFCPWGHPPEVGRGKRAGRQILLLHPQDRRWPRISFQNPSRMEQPSRAGIACSLQSRRVTGDGGITEVREAIKTENVFTRWHLEVKVQG